MTAVISGLVAVVLLVLLVVALGMRSMNRRESALSPERIKAMAENKGPKPRRPAEETFFESFPKGFDAFEEPERGSGKPRSGARPASRPGGRQSRPAQRGGKQAAASRGKRGVDEWGEADDYDDDYWSRVRADEGGFGGTIAAKTATPRPADETPGTAGAGPRAADPDAATVQAPLPTRPARAPRADEPASPAAPVSASALADQKTVTFSAPTPDVLDAPASPAGASSTGPFDASRTTGPFDSPAVGGSPAMGGAAPAARDPFAATGPQAGTTGTAGTTGASGRPARSSRSGRSSRAAARRAAAAAEAGQPGGAYDAPRGTGPLPSQAGAGSYGTQPGADPLGAATTGPFGAPAYDTPAGTGPFAAQGGAGSPDGRTAGGYTTPPSSPIPATGAFVVGSYEPARTSGAFEAATPAAPPADALADPAPRQAGGSFDAWPAYETPRSDGYDPSRTATGPFRAADTSQPYSADAAGATGANTGNATDPGWPAAGSYPPVSASSTSGSWPARDVLDDPEPPRGASSWPSAETYQTPAYEGGYSSGYAADGGYPAAPAPSPATPSASSYEVSTGWATIDASDTVTGPTPGTASPYESAGYDAPSGQSQYGYDRQQQGHGGAQSSWPEQNAGGSWPAYDELYGDAPTSASGRRGTHRNPESDYPDYYR
ncbi:hypothetical protein GCM10010116_52760 [Microbispora rosea subsp. aerata]|nr:hypothetical protein [Microbispora rosea]GGO26295.1 hypothetical protein GCM10010116_52760 [Microbispora rosea subsp. aerata]GIH54193.1 hypothetical protein Mro02_11070 [Microbispora rosea subsp. aerata]